MSKKTALVISGGGSKGAFAVGALKYILKEQDVRFDLVAGTSTGALISPFVVGERFHRARRLYLTSVTEDFVIDKELEEDDPIAMDEDEEIEKGFLGLATGDISFYDTTPLENVIDKEMDAEMYGTIQAASTRGVQMFLATVCLQSGKVVFFQTGPAARAPDCTEIIPITSHAMMKKAALASANQPILTPPVTIETAAGRLQYVDGGVREYAPLRAAVDNGAEIIYAIYLSPKTPKAVTQVFKEAIPTQASASGKRQSIIERMLDLFIADVKENDFNVLRGYNEAIRFQQTLARKMVAELNISPEAARRLFEDSHRESRNPYHDKKAITLYEIYPEKSFDVDSLHVDPVKMVAMHDAGYERARELLSA